MTARRRRRQGLQPFRGTGWAQGRTPAGHAPAQYSGAQPYYENNPNGAAAPPVYSPPATQGYYNQGYNNQGANQGYFGGQQQGVELQQPATAYARGGGEGQPFDQGEDMLTTIFRRCVPASDRPTSRQDSRRWDHQINKSGAGPCQTYVAFWWMFHRKRS